MYRIINNPPHSKCHRIKWQKPDFDPESLVPEPYARNAVSFFLAGINVPLALPDLGNRSVGGREDKG